MHIHKRNCCSNGSGGNGATLGIGLAAMATGAAITYYLYATERGDKTLGKIKNKFGHAKEKVMAMGEEAIEKGSDFIEEKIGY